MNFNKQTRLRKFDEPFNPSEIERYHNSIDRAAENEGRSLNFAFRSIVSPKRKNYRKEEELPKKSLFSF